MIILILHSINWPNFIVRLPLLLEILDNICIAIICRPVYDVINIEINLSFLIKPFFWLTKKCLIRLDDSYISVQDLIKFQFWVSGNVFTALKMSKYGGFFWSVFSCKSPYSVWIKENTDQKKLRIWTVFTLCFWYILCQTKLLKLTNKWMFFWSLFTYN